MLVFLKLGADLSRVCAQRAGWGCRYYRDGYRDGTDLLDMERRRPAVRTNHVTTATRNILWQRPPNPDAVAMFTKFAINAASMTSDRITALRCIGRHSPSCLKRRDTRIVPAVRLRNAKGPLMRWIVPEIVCGAPSGSMGKLIAIRTPTAHIPNRPRPVPERARLDTPRKSPITRAKEPKLILKKAEVIRNPYGPTAYSLVGLLIGLRSGRRKCNTTMMTAKYATPTRAIVATLAICCLVRRLGERSVEATLRTSLCKLIEQTRRGDCSVAGL